jgi:hypothetical protein
MYGMVKSGLLRHLLHVIVFPDIFLLVLGTVFDRPRDLLARSRSRLSRF